MTQINGGERDFLLPAGVSGSLNEAGRRPVVLSIAGFDPSSGAGITADLKVFAAFGLYGVACITALTVQSTQGVRAIEPIAVKTISQTLGMLAEDVPLAGIKVGMLGTGEAAKAVSDFLDVNPSIPVVLDPVFRSSSGRQLLDRPGLDLLRNRLLRRVNWMTPNIDELAVFTDAKVAEAKDVPVAAEKLRSLAVEAGNKNLHLMVTGGHLPTPDDYVLDNAGAGRWIPGDRVVTRATHGTGCALSSALLCSLVLGQDAYTAAVTAKRFVAEALQAAYPVGQGRGPMNHLFRCEARMR